MTRFRLLVEYDGTGLVGWQRQDHGLPSVQGALEQAVLALCGQYCPVMAAGRTDAGVHATGQVAHVDLPRPYRPDKVRDALNFHLRPNRMAVLDAQVADADFHARFSATGRAYLYRIVNRRAPLGLDQGRAWWVPARLDDAAMAAGAHHLLGHHDFTSFRASECQAKSPLKTLDQLDVIRCGDEIRIIAAARSFLHHQVRNMVGTLKMVGTGKWHPDRMVQVLAARNRAAAGPTAPPDGLYLTGVRYD